MLQKVNNAMTYLSSQIILEEVLVLLVTAMVVRMGRWDEGLGTRVQHRDQLSFLQVSRLDTVGLRNAKELSVVQLSWYPMSFDPALCSGNCGSSSSLLELTWPTQERYRTRSARY